MTQDAASGRTGDVVEFVFQLSINEHILDALRDDVGSLIGGTIENRVRIEDGYISEIADFQQSSILQALALRGEGSDLANPLFERHEMFIADVVAEETRHRTESPRVAMRFIGGSVQRSFWSIEPDAGPWLLQSIT